MRYLICPGCDEVAIEVSDEDEDASLTEMLYHIERWHAGDDRDVAMRLLAKVEVEEL